MIAQSQPYANQDRAISIGLTVRKVVLEKKGTVIQ